MGVGPRYRQIAGSINGREGGGGEGEGIREGRREEVNE